MLSTRFNTANLAALGPLLTTILVGLDLRFQWEMGNELMTAFAMAVMWGLTSITPDKGYIYKPEATNPNLKVSIVPLLLLLGLFFLLQGCSMVPYYSQLKQVADTGIVVAIADRKEFNDKKLALNLAVLCDSSIGAVNRYPNPEVRQFIDRLCGGDDTITADQLGRVALLLEQLEGTRPKIEAPVPPTEPLIEGEP